MKHSFFLSHPGKEQSAILIALRDQNSRVTISTGIVINVKNWDKERKCIRSKSSDAVYNERIQIIDSEIKKLIRHAVLDGLTLNQVKDSVAKFLGRRVNANDGSLFLSFYQYWATTSFNNHNATKYTLLGSALTR